MQLEHQHKKLDQDAEQLDVRARKLVTKEAAIAEREKQLEEQLLTAEDPNSKSAPNVRIHA